MKKNKMGILFLITMLATAGIGVSYAGWTDVITVTGTVSTGSVNWNVIEYSGTWVWKQISTHEIITHKSLVAAEDLDGDEKLNDDPLGYYENDDYILVASSYAMSGGDDLVTVEYDNIFPCVFFDADITVQYAGTIPARINYVTLINGLGVLDDYTTISITLNGVTYPQEQLLGIQIHDGDVLHVIMTIHLEQVQELQLLTGDFSVEVGIIQWNEYIAP